MLKNTRTLAALIIAASLTLGGCASTPDTPDEPEEAPQYEVVEEEEEAEEVPQESDDPTAAPHDVAEPPDNAEFTESGLASRVLREGDGDQHPTMGDQVVAHYSGWTTDGELFDSSYQRGEPLTFGLEQVIDGWTEGLQLMVVGEKRRIWIPEDLAYGGVPGRPAGMLVFDVELIEIR